jgi:anion-transporting  ArsA/GET3 family ATPase
MSSVLAVMLAETLPDRETERLLLELEKLKAPVAEMFVNRILLSGDLGRCGRCL